MGTTGRVQSLPDLAAAHCIHLSFCFMASLSEKLMARTVGSSRDDLESYGGSLLFGCDYSRRGKAHSAVLVIDQTEEGATETHMVLQCEPRELPDRQRGILGVHGRLAPSKVINRVQVGVFDKLAAALRFRDSGERVANTDATFEYPLGEYRPYMDLPIVQSEGIEIRGMRFATTAHDASIIIDLGPDEAEVFRATVRSRCALPAGEPLCAAALSVAVEDTQPFVVSRETG